MTEKTYTKAAADYSRVTRDAHGNAKKDAPCASPIAAQLHDLATRLDAESDENEATRLRAEWRELIRLALDG